MVSSPVKVASGAPETAADSTSTEEEFRPSVMRLIASVVSPLREKPYGGEGSKLVKESEEKSEEKSAVTGMTSVIYSKD